MASGFVIRECETFGQQRFDQLRTAIVLALISVFFFSATAYSAQVTIAWNPSADPATIGYKVYYGTQSRNYSQVIDVGANLSYSVTGLSASQAYYFAITAYTSSAESGFSPELVCYFITAATPANGQITPGGTTTSAAGSSQTFAIAPNAGYQISDVLIDGVSVGAVSQYTFSSLSACHSIAANFTPVSANYTISASVQGSGSISPSGTVSAAYGTNQTYTITPAANYQISGVKVDNVAVGAVSSYTFTSITANHTIVATFTPISYTISATVQGSGSISPSGTVSAAYGTNQTYTITPAANYQISGVKVDNISAGAVSSYTFTNITANHTIAATFTPINYTISATVQGSGSISPSGTVSAAYGTNQAYTITPAANYQISGVKIDNASVGAVSSYTFTNVTANHTIAATFAPITSYTVSATVQGSGSISPAGTVSVSPGKSKAFSITRAFNHRISGVLVDGKSVGAVSSYIFPHVAANHTIEAVFSELPLLVADAGSDQDVKKSSTVTLNGSNSTDAVSGISSYKWIQVSGPPVTLSNPSAPICTFTAPNTPGAKVLVFRLQVTNKAGVIKRNSCFVNVSSNDKAPLANAGGDQTVYPGIAGVHGIFSFYPLVNPLVTLNASGSSDPDDGIASFNWVQIEGPQVTIQNATSSQAMFWAPSPGLLGVSLVFELLVSDHLGLTTRDQCTVNVVNAALPPIALAGHNQTAATMSNVTLNGSGSSGSGGSPLTYRWKQISGVPVTLSDPTAKEPVFIAPSVSGAQSPYLLFMLTVTDPSGLSASAKCRVTVK